MAVDRLQPGPGCQPAVGPPAPRQPPDPAKVRALMAKAEAHSPEMGLFIRLAALLGARRGEL
jgi:hypothetical protein